VAEGSVGGFADGITSRVSAHEGAGLVRVWDTATGAPVATLPRIAADDPLPALGPDGRWVLTVADGGKTAELVEARTGKTVRALGRAGDPAPHALAFSPDGKLVAVAVVREKRIELRLWEPETGALAAALSGPEGE